jgi:hypothetical protein
MLARCTQLQEDGYTPLLPAFDALSMNSRQPELRHTQAPMFYHPGASMTAG